MPIKYGTVFFPFNLLKPDSRGPDYPTPYFETKMKIRWDDERLYIGVHMEETDFWGTITEDEGMGWYH